ncbi:histidine kinase [Flavitalea antarctica]
MIKNRRYPEVVLISIGVYVVGTGINYFTADLFLGSVQFSIPVTNNFQHRLEYANYNTRWALILGIIVIGIDLAKSWYLKSRENLVIFRKNAKAEMLVRKSRINPSWLFRALDKIKNNLDRKSGTATPMILNLSDLLSYSLYESDEDLVGLEKEFSGLQYLLSMEQLDVNALVRISVETSGDFSNKYLAPMSVITPVVEHINSAHDGGEEVCHMNLHFHAGKNILELISSTICGSGEMTKTFTWMLSGNFSKDRLRAGYA